jgi:D-alanine--D-alanine ligase
MLIRRQKVFYLAQNMNKNNQKTPQNLNVAIICGGPSPERGISLNSARSVMDHLGSGDIRITPFYLDAKKNPYRISTAQLYSNTPSDFDFKLKQTARPLGIRGFIRELKKTDIVFPVMHGAYGEDGGIQRFLEKHRIPFVGSGSASCRSAFDKFDANERIRREGFFTLPSALLKIYGKDHANIVRDFFKKHGIKRAVVKPATGGSSIGVFSVSTAEEAIERARHLFGRRMDTRLVIEPFAEGKEFTVIILKNRFGIPVALPPTEIETTYEGHEIFDFRKKYLPTRQVAYHSPPRFSDIDIERIQAEAEQLFALFNMRDFGRFDGWILPSGKIWFCDFNTISGMEQNSFLFQQAARIGMTHADVLRYVVENACSRYGIPFPEKKAAAIRARKPVSVLFGGPTSERQVSLMSGTNVWLKLRNSGAYLPQPYLMDTDGSVWHIPYHLALNHTVEEISANCGAYGQARKRLAMFEERARLHLGITKKKDVNDFFEPEQMTLDALIGKSHFIFNALHGGEGEDGTLQALLSKRGVGFNGPGDMVSRLCMDKWATAERIRALRIEGVDAIAGTNVSTKTLIDANADEVRSFWNTTRKSLRARTLVVKPGSDGCSTGIVHLYGPADLGTYLTLLKERAPHVPKGAFKNQKDIIEMPMEMPKNLIFERFVETDTLRVKDNRLKHRRTSGFVEITVGIIEMGGRLYALNPSITIAEGAVLTVEEKFQGGTGVNLTPPPASVMSAPTVRKIRNRIETLAQEIGIKGYSRIDAFADVSTGELHVIEINTLPGLTPSTVLYHQGLAERPAIFPLELLELLIKNRGY